MVAPWSTGCSSECTDDLEMKIIAIVTVIALLVVLAYVGWVLWQMTFRG